MISCFLHHRDFRSWIDNRHQIQAMDLHWHFDGNCVGLETTQNNWSSCLFLAVEHDVLVITWSPTGFLALNGPQALTGRCNDSLGVHRSSFRNHLQTALCRDFFTCATPWIQFVHKNFTTRLLPAWRTLQVDSDGWRHIPLSTKWLVFNANTLFLSPATGIKVIGRFISNRGDQLLAAGAGRNQFKQVSSLHSMLPGRLSGSFTFDRHSREIWPSSWQL